jgi:hypothetical protein
MSNPGQKRKNWPSSVRQFNPKLNVKMKPFKHPSILSGICNEGLVIL